MGYFQIWEHLCGLVDDNFNLITKILFLCDQTPYLNEYYILCLWLNTFTSSVVTISWNAKDHCFLTKHLVNDHDLPNGSVCPIGHEVFYELIGHSLMGGCLMIGVITLVSANQTFVPQSDEYWNIHSPRVLGTHKLTIVCICWMTNIVFPQLFFVTPK